MLEPAESLIASIASHGVLGLMLALSLYGLWSKDKQLEEERAARITDAQNYTNLALNLQAQVINTVNKLTDTFEEMKKNHGALKNITRKRAMSDRAARVPAAPPSSRRSPAAEGAGSGQHPAVKAYRAKLVSVAEGATAATTELDRQIEEFLAGLKTPVPPKL